MDGRAVGLVRHVAAIVLPVTLVLRRQAAALHTLEVVAVTGTSLLVAVVTTVVLPVTLKGVVRMCLFSSSKTQVVVLMRSSVYKR